MTNTADIPSSCARLLAIAERDPPRGLRLAHRAYTQATGDLATEGWAMYTLGRALLYSEEFDEAGAYLQRAHDQFVALNMSLAQLRCRAELLLRSQLDGGGIELQAEWDALAVAYAAEGLAKDVTRARFEQIAHLNALGRNMDALGQIVAIAPLVERSGSDLDRARLLRLRAVAQTNLGQLHEAQREIDAAISIYKRLRRPIEVAKCQINRAWLWQRRELFEDALADLDQAGAVFQRYRLASHQIFCARDFGLVASRLGHFDRALSSTLYARAQLLQRGRVAGAAVCDLHLGIVAYYSGLFELALGAYQRALQSFEALGAQRHQLVCRRNQTLVLLAQGQSAHALSLLDVLEQDARQAGERLEHAEIIQARGRALGQLRRYDDASMAFEQAHALFQNIGNAATAAQVLVELGWLAVEQGRIAVAENHFANASSMLNMRPMYQWRIDYGLGRCALARGDYAGALAAFQRSVAVVAGMRRRLISEHASSGLYSQARQLHVDALVLAVELNDLRAVMDLAQQQQTLSHTFAAIRTTATYFEELRSAHDRQRASLRALIEQRAAPQPLDAAMNAYVELLLQLRHAQPLPDADTRVQALDHDVLWTQLDAAFPNGWTALTYIVNADEIMVLTFDERGLELCRIPLSEEFEQLVRAASHPSQRFATYVAADSADGASWAVLSALSQQLLPAAVGERLDPARRLMIAPGGLLHTIPWGALRVGDKWLCECAVVQLVPDLRHWAQLAARVPSGSAVLALGCEAFRGRAPDLPNALTTLELVMGHGPSAMLRLENDAASRETLLRLSATGELTGYAHIHISSHARVVAERGLFAHLKLADDDLFYDEVARLELGGALVVLSACDSAWSEVLPGEEVLSLSRAFLAAGARDVVASLWSVYDRAVSNVLRPFYDALAQGCDAATALAIAQRAVIERHRHGVEANSVVTSPLVWGSFCVLGAGLSVWPSAGGTKPAADRLYQATS